MATKAEAKQLCAEELRLVPVGQAMQSHHDTRMGEAYDQVYAALQVKRLAVWDATASMPDEIVPHFVALMADNKKDIVGVSDAIYQRILFRVGSNGEKAFDNIRNLINPSFQTQDRQTDY